MANKLKKMRLVSVDLVPRGANQDADICLYKGMDEEHPEEPQTISKSDPDRFDYIREFP